MCIYSIFYMVAAQLTVTGRNSSFLFLIGTKTVLQDVKSSVFYRERSLSDRIFGASLQWPSVVLDLCLCSVLVVSTTLFARLVHFSPFFFFSPLVFFVAVTGIVQEQFLEGHMLGE